LFEHWSDADLNFADVGKIYLGRTIRRNDQRYRVTYANDTLVEGRRRNPVFDACRALIARGITSRLEVWRPGKVSADMQLDIERGAGLAIKEAATESLRIMTWEPWRPNPDGASHGRVSYRRVQPLAAADETQVSEPL
jgi:hypothetical protein